MRLGLEPCVSIYRWAASLEASPTEHTKYDGLQNILRFQNCGFETDRDLNAALNIRDEAMKQIRQELPEFKPAENPTPGSQMFDSRCDPMKQEAVDGSPS